MPAEVCCMCAQRRYPHGVGKPTLQDGDTVRLVERRSGGPARLALIDAETGEPITEAGPLHRARPRGQRSNWDPPRKLSQSSAPRIQYFCVRFKRILDIEQCHESIVNRVPLKPPPPSSS